MTSLERQMMTMKLMNNTPARVIIFRIIGLCIFGIILWFSYTRFSGYLSGPVMIENSLEDIYETSTSTIVFEGSGKRIDALQINGRETTLNSDGTFREMVVLLPGSNIIEVDIFDQFGKHRRFEYRIYGDFVDDERVFDYDAVRNIDDDPSHDNNEEQEDLTDDLIHNE